jgi:hypothetical protein
MNASACTQRETDGAGIGANAKLQARFLPHCHINLIILDCTCVAVPILKIDLGFRTILFRDRSARYCDGLSSVTIACLPSVSIGRELAIAISTDRRFSLQSSRVTVACIIPGPNVV